MHKIAHENKWIAGTARLSIGLMLQSLSGFHACVYVRAGEGQWQLRCVHGPPDCSSAHALGTAATCTASCGLAAPTAPSLWHSSPPSAAHLMVRPRCLMMVHIVHETLFLASERLIDICVLPVHCWSSHPQHVQHHRP